uniref:Mini-chromosome maintenance complex-binding protein n=1 Tax=Esox lucius TaxID=8010 RepID=A0A6Q2XSQ8_ESOLU
MPSSNDWINNPLGVVEEMFVQSNSNPEWEAKVLEYFKGKLKEKQAYSWIPSLNDVPLHYLKPNSLVKFRCLVQDMFDPEFYMGVYETIDPSTKAKVLRFGKYKDVTECGVDLNSRNTVTAERQTFYCVPIPGETLWAFLNHSHTYARSSQARVVPSTSYIPSRQKRSYEEDDEMDTQPQKQREPHTELHANGDSKRQETEAPSGQTTSPSNASSPLDLNFPLPGERGPACLVKVYEDLDSFKLNDMLEVYGILSVNPLLSVLCEEKDPSASLLDPTESMETPEEQRAHDPPASLVPRLHMLHARPLQHNNPLLGVGKLYRNMETRGSQRDVLPLGKFTLNLSGCPPNSSFTESLHQVIQELVPCTYRLSMTLHNMNSLRLVPRKDYVANRLVSGALQLARNTSLVLDETRLEQGQLDASGVQNITALGNLISWQKVDYDFNYHQMEFPCNINVFVTSEGRSLLPSDCQVPLQPQVTPPNLEEYLSTVHKAQLTSQINKFRVYLSVAQTLDYSISDEVTKAVEDDFVDMRKDDPQSVSAEDLHRMLVVARLLSLSLGQTSLSREGWMRAKHIDMLRRTRSQPQTTVNGNEP